MSKIMKFGAPWCAPCKTQDKILNQLTGIDVEYVDVDKDELLAEKWEIYNVPTTIILDDEGNEIHRFIGLVQLDTIKEYL